MLWIGSENASFINGEVLVIDGGLSVSCANYQTYVQDAELADEI